jgi:hypothetical protein
METQLYIYVPTDSKSMKLVCLNFALLFTIGVGLSLSLFLAGSANAQNQNITPSMVINMSDLSIKVGNTTSNETISFSNNTGGEPGNSTRTH